MKPPARLIGRVTLREGAIVLAAMMVFALSSIQTATGTEDDLPWWWADPSGINTIDLAGMPPGPHKIRIELVNANHEVFPGQSKTVTFTVPKSATRSHSP